MTPGRIAYDDQFQAATAEARRQLDQAAASTGSAVRRSDAWWIRDRFRRFAATFLAGKGRFCPHIGNSPMLAHTAAWATDQLVCTACVGTTQPPEQENGRCDRCREPATQLHTGVAAHGPVLMTYRLCTPCTHPVT